MKPVKTFTIVPSLPKNLEFLRTLALNLWWSWNYDALDLLRRLDPELWEATNHNPIKILGRINQQRLEALSNDDGFLAHLARVEEALRSYLSEQTWFEKIHGKTDKVKIAYFSAEFGFTECLPNYSGGLGVLAGDHIKSASDLGLPLVGVGLLYQQGYFFQYLNADGWQGEEYLQNDFYNMPIQLQTNKKGEPLVVEIDFPERTVYAQIWRLQVGRVFLYLLDTNTQKNSTADRLITGELYGGDNEVRIKQEILLGIGGVRALALLGIEPVVYHMNEGHSAFLGLERIRWAVEKYHLEFAQALELLKRGNVFTTHTPVPAGIDQFSQKLMEQYFSDFIDELGIDKATFFELGGIRANNNDDKFSMAVLAINLACYINGVSKLHGEVSRKMWQYLWKDVPVNEIPIGSITNGVHPSSFISKDLAGLFERYIGPNWIKKPADLTIWKRVDQIPSEELWRTHERRRERLVAFARNRLKKQLENRGALSAEIQSVEDTLNPEALTIGFARRFATYKRATLIFQDPDRLAKILNNKDHPVQIIFAGKAHPLDDPGKQLIKTIVHYSNDERFRRHIVFLENYDIEIARYLVQGVDLWLNTPRRYLEASGTSGMKAAMNGVINCSILDGWWDEAYSRTVGWAIGSGESYEDHAYQDLVESQALYNILENEVIPLFYKRGQSNVPRTWIELMKNSMSEICPVFNTNRMIQEYTDKFYIPAMKNYKKMFSNGQQCAKEMAEWKAKIRKHWCKIHIKKVGHNGDLDFRVGSEIKISAEVNLDGLSPADVAVEIYHGFLDAEKNVIENGTSEPMQLESKKSENVYLFSGILRCHVSGLYAYTVRIIPQNENLVHPHETGLITWAA